MGQKRRECEERIEKVVKDYISGKMEYSTPSYVIGKILSEITHNGWGVKECHKLIERIRKEIEMSTLFPSIPKEEKLRRLEILEKQLKDKTWWYGEHG